MEEESSSSSTEPEGSTSADPLGNGGGVARQVEEIRLAKSDADPDGDDGTMSREAAAHAGDGDDERDDAGGGPVVASSAASASSAVTATSTATPSRSPTLSPDVAPHPQQNHRPRTHEPTPPVPPPPPTADRADGDGDDAPFDENENVSMGETGSAGGGETNGEFEHEPSGEGDDGDGTPSVKQLKGWLAEFEKEQQKHFTENRLGSTPSTRPPAIRASASVRSDIGSCSAPSSPARKVKRSNGFGATAGSGTPGRLLRKSTSLRVASGEVQATDDGRAPVQTVSAWLTEGDPFHEKRGSKGNVKKLLSSADGVPLVTKVDVTDRKKWLEGAFQKKGKDGGAGGGSREGSFDCGDSTTSDGGERGSTTTGPASAEHNQPDEKARGSVKEAARMFGGSVSDAPRRDRVREMKEAMERRNEELVRSSDPRNFHKTRWETVSGTTRPSAYKKKITDERGTAPKRSLADLP